MVGPLDYTWVYANEVTHGSPSDSFRIGSGQERSTMWSEDWGFQPSGINMTSWPPSDEGRGLGTEFSHLANDSINHTWIPKDWWVSLFVIQNNVPGGYYILRTWKLYIWAPPRSHPMCLYIGQVLICILYNETLIVSIASSSVLWIVLVNHQTWQGSGDPQIYSRLVRSVGGLGSLELATSV